MVSAADLRAPPCDEIGFRLLLLDHAERLGSFVSSRIPAKHKTLIGVEDVLQDVWIAAFRGSHDFIPDGPDAFARWLTRIAERKLLDAVRHARAAKRGGDQSLAANGHDRSASFLDLFCCVAAVGQRTPSSEDAAREAAHAVQIALISLPDDYRNAVTMYHIEGRPRSEVARRMGRSLPAVNSLLYRGRRMLRQRLGPAGKFFTEVTSSEEV